MNKFFKEYFHDAKHDKIKENVFVFRMCFSVGIIFVCMFAMAFAAYGFFSSDIYTQPSAISSARYSLSVKGMEGMVLPVWEASDTEQTDSVQIMSPNAPAEVSMNVPGSVAQYSLAPGNYTFVLEKEVGPDFASTGYCKIVFNGKYQAENSDAYYTKQIGAINPEESKNLRYVYISVSETTVVDFVPSWGTYSGEGFDESTTTISPSGQQVTNVNQTPDEPPLLIRSLPITKKTFWKKYKNNFKTAVFQRFFYRFFNLFVL